MDVYNKEDCCFNIGDTVFIASTSSPDDDCYPAEVISIVGPDRMGTHYVLLVRSCVDNYLTIRWDKECFRSEEQYERLAKEVRAQRIRKVLEGYKKKEWGSYGNLGSRYRDNRLVGGHATARKPETAQPWGNFHK